MCEDEEKTASCFSCFLVGRLGVVSEHAREHAGRNKKGRKDEEVKREKQQERGGGDMKEKEKEGRMAGSLIAKGER